MVGQTKANNVKTFELLKEKFVIIDEQASYTMQNGSMFLKIDLPKTLKEIVIDDNLSGSGKTYRVYSNSTNRKFIKNPALKLIQCQINMYLSVKDSEKL